MQQSEVNSITYRGKPAQLCVIRNNAYAWGRIVFNDGTPPLDVSTRADHYDAGDEEALEAFERAARNPRCVSPATGWLNVGWERSIYEVTAAGFDGGTDATDDRVLWIEAETEEQVREAIKGMGATFCGELPRGHGDNDIDYWLPDDAAALTARLAELAPAPWSVSEEFYTHKFLVVRTLTPGASAETLTDKSGRTRKFTSHENAERAATRANLANH